MCAKKVPLRHWLRNTDGEALMQAIKDSGKTTEEKNLSATSFFRRDPRYGPKHYDTRNKVLSSTQSTEDRKNSQFNAEKINSSYKAHKTHSTRSFEESRKEASIIPLNSSYYIGKLITWTICGKKTRTAHREMFKRSI